MLSPIDPPRHADPSFYGDDPLLDLDAFEAPRNLSRDERRVAAGPDWSWSHLISDEEPEND